jgi:glycosyltransferase involved in cell wall biosynthesis
MTGDESQSHDPVVTIVLCAWKPRPSWLHDAVRSALRQEDCDLELVVVDDGSPEPIAGLLSDIRDERLRVLRIEHGGLAHARNEGMRAARGRFFRFADADDVLAPESTARLLRLAREGAIAYGATLVCDERLEPLEIKTSRLEGWVARECLRYRFDVRHMSMLFPRPVVEAVGEWDTTLLQCQDWDFVLRALERAPVRADAAVATYYRRHAASASANVSDALRFESLVVDRYFERHPEQAGGALERSVRAKLLLVRASATRRVGGGRREQVRLVLSALALHPGRVVRELGEQAFLRATRRARRIRGASVGFAPRAGSA